MHYMPYNKHIGQCISEMNASWKENSMDPRPIEKKDWSIGKSYENQGVKACPHLEVDISRITPASRLQWISMIHPDAIDLLDRYGKYHSPSFFV